MPPATARLVDEESIKPDSSSLLPVCASPSKSNPDYYYHWTHDAGVTLLEVSTRFNTTSDATEIATYKQKLSDYATFSRGIQAISSASGIRTAKSNMDGSAYTGSWCNPQRNGAATRALSLISFAHKLISEGSNVATYYDGQCPTSSVVMADLEYVANNWNADKNGCDI
ncbi:hypothetical protein FBU59_000975 [Linderina macrospora]|uniref:Uncharacterized protein n=1 Tax=Linderina macrospora TaxID=4868 RepID=A0ACC1JFL5_9FUNG|nr:hypothetical protein FBU59_000975 [Linderina macrospora]